MLKFMIIVISIATLTACSDRSRVEVARVTDCSKVCDNGIVILSEGGRQVIRCR